MTSIKFQFGSDFRRVTLKEDLQKITIVNILDYVSKLFPSLSEKGILLFWEDDEKDLINCCTDEELQEAIRIMNEVSKTLKFTIKLAVRSEDQQAAVAAETDPSENKGGKRGKDSKKSLTNNESDDTQSSSNVEASVIASNEYEAEDTSDSEMEIEESHTRKKRKQSHNKDGSANNASGAGQGASGQSDSTILSNKKYKKVNNSVYNSINTAVNSAVSQAMSSKGGVVPANVPIDGDIAASMLDGTEGGDPTISPYPNHALLQQNYLEGAGDSTNGAYLSQQQFAQHQQQYPSTLLSPSATNGIPSTPNGLNASMMSNASGTTASSKKRRLSYSVADKILLVQEYMEVSNIEKKSMKQFAKDHHVNEKTFSSWNKEYHEGKLHDILCQFQAHNQTELGGHEGEETGGAPNHRIVTFSPELKNKIDTMDANATLLDGTMASATNIANISSASSQSKYPMANVVVAPTSGTGLSMNPTLFQEQSSKRFRLRKIGYPFIEENLVKYIHEFHANRQSNQLQAQQPTLPMMQLGQSETGETNAALPPAAITANGSSGAGNGRAVLTWSMLKQKALEIAQDNGIADFKASDGWIQNILKRNAISLNGSNGVGSSVGNNNAVAAASVSASSSNRPGTVNTVPIVAALPDNNTSGGVTSANITVNV